MKGRPRKPTPTKILHGTFRKDRHKAQEPQPEAPQTVDPPAWLDDYGRECWQAHVPQLLSLGVLSSIDVFYFAAVCERWSVYRKAVDDLKNGLTQVTEANGECSKPTVSIAKDAFNSFGAGLAEFGCSPATRSKVSAVKPRADDPFAQYRARKSKTGVARFLT